MFPGPGAIVYRNEAGEPLGWDYPSDEQPDPDDYDDYDDRWMDDDDEPFIDGPLRDTYAQFDQYKGVAFYIDEDDGESMVAAHMVGDDRRFVFDRDEVKALPREDFCIECGQIGCEHDGYDREGL